MLACSFLEKSKREKRLQIQVGNEIMKDLVIFGAGQIAEVIHYYFTQEAGRKVVAFSVDAKYRTAEMLLGLPVVSFENLNAGLPAGNARDVRRNEFPPGQQGA